MPEITTGSPQLRLVLLGLEPKTATEILTVMPKHADFVQRPVPEAGPDCHELLDKVSGSIVFCPPRIPQLPHLIEAASRCQASIVVVAQHPCENEWLDVLDAGASDYIAPPFESVHIRWIIDSCLGHSKPNGAARTDSTQSATG